MRKLKKVVTTLMLVLMLGLAAPQALAGEIPSTDVRAPGDVQAPALIGDISCPGFTDVVKLIIQIVVVS
jgi:hypothetical protein